MATNAAYLGALYIAKRTAYKTVTAGANTVVDFNKVDFSIEVWFKSQVSKSIIKKLNGTDGYQLAVNGASKVVFTVSDGVGTDTVTSTGSITTGWNHIVAVRDHAGTMKTYLNGAAADSVADSDYACGNTGTMIAGDATSAATYGIATVRFWGTALTALEAAALYVGTYVKDNILEWLLFENTGTKAFDSSNHGYIGTVATKISTVYNQVTNEAVGNGDGAEIHFTLDYNNVEDDDIVITVNAVIKRKGYDYNINSHGEITFNIAPPLGEAIVATYKWYPIVLESAGFYSYTLDEVTDVLEKTDFTSTGDRTYIPGLTGWTASAERHWVHMHHSESMIKYKYIVRFYWNVAADNYYEGWAFVSGLSTSNPVDGLLEESLTFQGTGIIFNNLI